MLKINYESIFLMITYYIILLRLYCDKQIITISKTLPFYFDWEGY